MADIKQVDGLWPIERVSIPELAMIYWETLHDRPGFYATDEEREAHIKAMTKVLDALVDADNARLYP